MMVNTNQDKIPLTKQGLENLKKEYQELMEVRRPQAVTRMASSRKVGDMTEESEYTQAKQDLDFIDGRISELDGVITKAMIIDEMEKLYQKLLNSENISDKLCVSHEICRSLIKEKL